MICGGTDIVVREEGESQKIETVSIGEFIYDPFGDKYCEIIDILSREVAFGSCGDKHPLYPVTLELANANKRCDRRKICVSPSQPIMVSSKGLNNEGYTVVAPRTALSLISTGLAKRPFSLTSVTYFAVFTETYQYFDVGGMLVRTYSNDIYGKYQPVDFR